MTDLLLDRYPLVAQLASAQSWLTFQVNLQHSPNTIDAYARDLQDYFAFCQRLHVPAEGARRDHIALYIRDMANRPRPDGPRGHALQPQTGLANATMQRRLTTLRLYYDYLMEEGVCSQNPVGRGRYTPGTAFAGARERGLLHRYKKLPWIPNRFVAQ